MRSYCVMQADLDFLGSSDSPASAPKMRLQVYRGLRQKIILTNLIMHIKSYMFNPKISIAPMK